MKAKTIIHLAIGVLIIPFLASFLVLSSHQAQAQDSGDLDPSEKYSQEGFPPVADPDGFNLSD
jgi:hypothetical protein